MQFESGYQGPPRSEWPADLLRLTDYVQSAPSEGRTQLTGEEADRIADGEPYCFHCGKPASSFPEYQEAGQERFDAKDYVLHEEGTYNPTTNRFACDECYIAIGMPAGEPGDAYGWKAP